MKNLQLLLIGVIVTLGIALYVWATQNGIAISPDSVTYLDAARNLNLGNGLVAYDMPLVHYPALYPAALALVSLGQPDAISAAWWLHLGLLITNTFLFARLVSDASNRSTWTVILAVALFMTSRSTLMIHTYAWSEPLFMVFCFSVLLVLVSFFSKGKNYQLWLLAIFTALATATRYLGLVLLPVVSICLLLNQTVTFGHRMKRTTVYLMGSLIFIAPIFLRNFLLLNQPSNREFVFHPVTINKIIDLVSNSHNFFLPETQSYPVKILEILMLTVGILLIAAYSKMHRPITQRRYKAANVFIVFSLLFVIVMLAAILISITFFDASTPLDSRILYPVFIFGLLMLISLATRPTLQLLQLKPLMAGLLLFSAITNLSSSIPYASSLHQAPENLVSEFWLDSPTLEAVEKLSSDPLIISNGFDLIKVHTWRRTNPPPQKIYRDSLIVNPDFEAEVEKFCSEKSNLHRIVVYFDALQRDEFLTKAEFLSACPSATISEFADGSFIAP